MNLKQYLLSNGYLLITHHSKYYQKHINHHPITVKINCRKIEIEAKKSDNNIMLKITDIEDRGIINTILEFEEWLRNE